jgi:hypothetical protein
MRATLSKAVFVLLVCSCLSAELNWIGSRGSAVNVEAKLDTQGGASVSGSLSIPIKAEISVPSVTIDITKPAAAQTDSTTQQSQPQTAAADSTESKKIEVDVSSLVSEKVPSRIFEILIRKKGDSVCPFAKLAEVAFTKLIKILSQQKLIDEKDFANISELDDKARLALVEKLTAAIKKLQELTKGLSAKLAALPASTQNSCSSDPVSKILSLLSRAKRVLEARIQSPVVQIQSQQTQGCTKSTCGCCSKSTCGCGKKSTCGCGKKSTCGCCSKSTCPLKAKLDDLKAQGALPQGKKFVCPYKAKIEAQKAQGSASTFTCPNKKQQTEVKPPVAVNLVDKVEGALQTTQHKIEGVLQAAQQSLSQLPPVQVDGQVKIAAAAPSIVQPASASIQIDIGSKVGRRLKMLKSLNA